MITSTFNFKRFFIIVFCIGISISINAQKDSSFFKRVQIDTSKEKLNMDGVYNKPFLAMGKMPVAMGGYMEANTQYSVSNGINADGFAFQFQRVSMFLESSIGKNIKFNSEIEYEDGGEEIEVEYAFMDMTFNPLLNFRGGIVLNPIGSFNENHDGPRWDFIDRPISSTTIIPSTLSNAGFGFYGKYFLHDWTFAYETYLTNGFDEGIVSNVDGQTSLADGNQNPEKFDESNSGLPMFTGKIAIRHRKIGELGISYLTDVYNEWKTDDGLIIAPKLSASIFALDYSTSLFNNRFTITTEAAKVWVQLPLNTVNTYGSQQEGAFIDFVGTVIKRKMFGWENAKWDVALRLEYANYNMGTFTETGGPIYDYIWAIVPGIAFRPIGSTVLRLNYVYSQQSDEAGGNFILGNPPVKTGTLEFGISTYF
jgi:hypothetical protein